MLLPKRINWTTKKLVFSVYLFVISLQINAQTLSINSTNGQTGTSGTNWSISANTLTVTGTANIRASVITNALINGSLTILGSTNVLDVTVDEGITATTSGSGITIGNTNSTGIVTFNQTIDIHGALTVYANQIRMGNTELSPGLSAELITRVSNGHISLLAKNGFETVAVTSCVRGKIMTAGGGNIHISSDADNNNTGTLNIDWLTIDGTTGAVLMEGDHYSWNTSNGCTMPEFYGTGDFTIRTTNNSSFDFSTLWIALHQEKASITFGRVNNTGNIEIIPCTACNGTPMNSAGQSITATNGNITLNGGNIFVNHNLVNTTVGGSILLKATKKIEITNAVFATSDRMIQTNNGNIVLWSNSLGGTSGGIQIGNWTTLNAANGATNQASGGGKVWLAGGTAVDAAGLPTGPAIGTDNTWSGISLGAYSSGATTTSIYSGGGDIFMNGETNCIATAGHGLGVSWNRTGICRAGNGTISIKGEAKNASGSHGIEIGAYGGNVEMLSSGGSSTVPAIKLEGKTARNDFSGIQTGGNSMQASGTGGITVLAIGNNGGTYASCQLGMSLLSASGDIFVSAQGGTGLNYGGTIGKLAGSTVTSSSSNITLQSNRIAVNGSISVDATGVLVLEPHTTSFTNALTWPITNFTVANGLTGLRLGKDGNAANMTISSAQSIAGPISIFGGDITLNHNLTSTASNARILAKATGQINTGGSLTFQTNNGDLVFWSDADNTSGGRIWLGSNVVINTANGSTANGLSGGGKIILAGGLDNGANGGTANDGIPDGFASNSSNIGLYIGNVNTSYTQMYSGGGDVILRGSSSAVIANTGGIGVFSEGRWLANAGKGSISIQGSSTHFYGINFTNPLSNLTGTSKHLEFISDKASGNAFEITGTSNASYGVVFNYNNPKELLATGGGAIKITGTGGGGLQGIFIQNVDILATSGDIDLNGGVNGIRVASVGTRLGSRASTSITSSTSNIKWSANSLDLYTLSSGFTNNFNTSGTVTIEPSGDSFTSAITFPISNLTLSSTVSGLTVGKTTNTANITLGSAQTIEGPITIYGGNVFAEHNLTSTLSGAAILLQARGYIDVSATKTIETNNGNITLRANASGTANTITSAITLNSGAKLLSTGGNITLGGNFAGTQGAGLYAASAKLGGTPGILINNATLNAAGGNINIYGRCSTSYDDGIRLQASISTTGAGTIGLYGDAFGGYNGTQFFGGITFFNEISRIETENGNVTLEGILTNSQNTQGYALSFYRNPGSSGQTKHIQILSQTGDIQITADPGNTIGQGIGHSSHGNIYFGSPSDNTFTASGDIKFTYSNLVNAGANGFKVKTNGAVTYEPVATSFIANQIFPPNANYTVAESASSLTIGKPGNTANITMNAAQTVAGPITIYAGTITLNAGLTSSNNGDISFYSDNAIAGLSSPRTINASGAMNFIPQSASFAAAVTYPIPNLNVTSAGLLIGKPTNEANVTIASPTTIAGPISIYGGTVALNQNIESSNGSTITLFANTLTIPSDKTVKSSGQLIVAPQSTLNTATIGLAGATGTLQLPAAYFSTNFVDGFSEIQIGTNNHSGAITTNAFTLRDHMSLLTSGALTLGGIPVLGPNNLTLGSGITTITSGTTNYFQTNGTGKVIRSIPTGSNLLFPIGNAAYNPLSIKNNTGTSDVFSANVIDAVYLNGVSGTEVSTTVVDRTWDISKATNTNTSPGVDFEFGWNAGEIANGTTLTEPRMNHHTGSVWEVPTVSSITFGTNTLSVVGYTGSFSPFAISEGSSALPVELLSFTAQCEDNSVKLLWETASEHNASHFELERSVNGTDWEQIGAVAAAGNSTELQTYAFEDNSIFARTLVYYRLNQVDIDGNTEVFGPVYSNCASEEGWKLTVAPNPTNGNFGLYISSETEQAIHIQILGSDGKIITNQKVQIPVGTSIQYMHVNDAKPGMYILIVQHKNGTSYQKLVVN